MAIGTLSFPTLQVQPGPRGQAMMDPQKTKQLFEADAIIDGSDPETSILDARLAHLSYSPEARLHAAEGDFKNALQGLSPEQQATVGAMYQKVQANAGRLNYNPQVQFPLAVMNYANDGLKNDPCDKGLARAFHTSNNVLEAYVAKNGMPRPGAPPQ